MAAIRVRREPTRRTMAAGTPPLASAKMPPPYPDASIGRIAREWQDRRRVYRVTFHLDDGGGGGDVEDGRHAHQEDERCRHEDALAAERSGVALLAPAAPPVHINPE